MRQNGFPTRERGGAPRIFIHRVASIPVNLEGIIIVNYIDLTELRWPWQIFMLI